MSDGTGMGGVGGGAQLSQVDDKSDPKNMQELTQYVQGLLQNMQDKFQMMSDQILNRIDEMGNRVDDLEKNIADLMTQAGAGTYEPLPAPEPR